MKSLHNQAGMPLEKIFRFVKKDLKEDAKSNQTQFSFSYFRVLDVSL